MRKSFHEFLMLKEGKEKEAVSEVKLSDDSNYKPFYVDEERHANLRVLINAFNDSNKVALPGPGGYPEKMTHLDPKGGVVTPKLKKKTIHLVGGAVRDHLRGKTPKDFDVATDATPAEIRLILRSAGFTESKPQGGKHAPGSKYEKHPEAGSRRRIFYAKGWDRAGNEFVMGVRINGEEFEVATFRRDSKSGDGRTPDKMEFSSLEEDADRRDFTINSMYIPLTNADGANAKLIDPHGGAHHLKAGEVKFVGNAKDRLEEDQLRALRYIRFAARFGGAGHQVPDEYKEAITEIKDLPSVSRERVRDEFVKGLEHPDVDPLKYIKMYKELGLLDTVFPEMEFKLDEPKDFSDKKHKNLAVAWILRHNDPGEVGRMLGKGTWTRDEIRNITHLIDMFHWQKHFGRNEEEFFGKYPQMKSDFSTRTKMVPHMIRQWGAMTKMNPEMLEKYAQSLDEDPIKGYTRDVFGGRSINPEILKKLGRTPQGEEFGHTLKDLEREKFKGKFS